MVTGKFCKEKVLSGSEVGFKENTPSWHVTHSCNKSDIATRTLALVLVEGGNQSAERSASI